MVLLKRPPPAPHCFHIVLTPNPTRSQLHSTTSALRTAEVEIERLRGVLRSKETAEKEILAQKKRQVEIDRKRRELAALEGKYTAVREEFQMQEAVERSATAAQRGLVQKVAPMPRGHPPTSPYTMVAKREGQPKYSTEEVASLIPASVFCQVQK